MYSVFALVLVCAATAVVADHQMMGDHEINKRQPGPYYPSSDVLRKLDALRCQADYIEAVEQEIQQSTCLNTYYFNQVYNYRLCVYPHYTNDTEIKTCYSDCAYRQFYYMECSFLAEQFEEVDREWSLMPFGNRPDFSACYNDKGDFCALKRNQTYQVLVECYATNTPEASNSFENFTCSQRCRDAVNEYVDNTGCCIATNIRERNEYFTKSWNNTNHPSYGGLTIGEIFSKCGVPVPSNCTNYSPPKEMESQYLACAREGALGITNSTNFVTFFASLVGVFLALSQ